jgi:SAM-dependent methyltransferase
MAQSTPRFSHWNKHAQQWRYVKAPLRPCAEDIALIEQALAEHFPMQTRLDALMLGVTPELAAKSWMPALNLVAVDNTLAMIQSVWPKNDAHRMVLCGNWLQLPLHDARMNLAMIDGGLPAISFPGAHQKLATELHRVLKPGGLFVARIFARPDTTESVDDVLTAAHRRQIGNFHIFKWRLAMALQGENADRGVRVDDVWRSVDKHFGQAARLAELTGWPINEISTIDAYRGSRIEAVRRAIIFRASGKWSTHSKTHSNAWTKSGARTNWLSAARSWYSEEREDSEPSPDHAALQDQRSGNRLAVGAFQHRGGITRPAVPA